jgi:deoxyribodipyrimidine photo-lyase
MEITIVWLRRDLRLDDNSALYHALRNNKNVQPLFIFDTEILNKLEDKHDRRVDFIHKSLVKLNNELKELGSTLWVEYGKPMEVYKKLAAKHQIKNVYTNHDYEPYANERDEQIKEFPRIQKKSTFESFKDQCVFEKGEVFKR